MAIVCITSDSVCLFLATSNDGCYFERFEKNKYRDDNGQQQMI